MGAVYDDLPGHEGYALRDQHEPEWTAVCSCGWRDECRTDEGAEGYEAAIDRWDTVHAQQLLERAVPVEVAELVTELRRAVSALAAQRPAAARAILDQLDRWRRALRAQGLGVAQTTPTVQERLDALATRSQRGDRRLGR